MFEHFLPNVIFFLIPVQMIHFCLIVSDYFMHVHKLHHECLHKLYLFQWIFLKHNTSWSGSPKDLLKETDSFIKQSVSGKFLFPPFVERDRVCFYLGLFIIWFCVKMKKTFVGIR